MNEDSYKQNEIKELDSHCVNHLPYGAIFQVLVGKRIRAKIQTLNYHFKWIINCNQSFQGSEGEASVGYSQALLNHKAIQACVFQVWWDSKPWWHPRHLMALQAIVHTDFWHREFGLVGNYTPSLLLNGNVEDNVFKHRALKQRLQLLPLVDLHPYLCIWKCHSRLSKSWW